MGTGLIRSIRLIALTSAAMLLAGAAPCSVLAQGTGTVTGTVTRVSDNAPLSGVSVSVMGTNVRAITRVDGSYTLHRVPAGEQTLMFRQLGHRPARQTISVGADATVTADAALVFEPVTLGEMVVTGASRVPERVVEAPAAVASVDPVTLRDASITGQAPLVLNSVPGVDVLQSGINDFNVNSRGFNSSLTRRVLVLQDGRDVAIGFLGSQEWSTFSLPTEDIHRIEFVRGPGSALYGANAYAGVLAITTPPARDVAGTKLTLAGGELSTFRGDLRHAGVLGEGRFGYRVNAGYARNDTWSRSRTLLNGTSLQDEYRAATDSVVPLAVEVRPLAGQTLDATGAPQGDPDNLQQIYGSGRFDFYAPDGSVLTIDGGAARSQNGVVVTGIGRVEIRKSLRPWARVAWAANNYNLMAWYSGRNSLEPQFSLASGAGLETRSDIFHVEGQYNRSFLEDRGRVVIGASFRSAHIDTEGTLMATANDDRTDQFFAGYAQLEYRITPRLRVVGAGRLDKGDLYDLQFSPKGAVVVSPNEDHSVRFTFNHAFQTPNYSEFFLQVPAGAPQTGPRALELGIEQYFAALTGALGPAVAALNLPSNLPWEFDSLTQPLALGNAVLDVETVNSVELGYKGNLTPKVYVTADFYYSELENFVTDLLPGVNPAFPTYSLTDGGTNIPQNLDDIEALINALEAGGFINAATAAALRAPIPTLRAGHAGLDAALDQTNLLATLPTGQRAIVVSYTNAGRVTEQGVELGIGAYLTDEFKVDASYTFFEFDVKQQQLGDVLLPNTPKHKVTASASYRGRQGFDVSASGRWIDGYQWAAGVFAGWIPSSVTISASAGYAINNYVRVHATATNVLDQQRFHIFGGSVIGRRVIGGLTATF